MESYRTPWLGCLPWLTWVNVVFASSQFVLWQVQRLQLPSDTNSPLTQTSPMFSLDCIRRHRSDRLKLAMWVLILFHSHKQLNGWTRSLGYTDYWIYSLGPLVCNPRSFIRMFSSKSSPCSTGGFLGDMIYKPLGVPGKKLINVN